MNFPSSDDKEKDLQRRESDLQKREREVRLRELEAEIYGTGKENEPPLYQTKKHTAPEKSLQNWKKKLVKFSKFAACAVLGIALVRVGIILGTWLLKLIIAAVVAFIVYKIFFKDDNPKKT